MSPEKPHRTDLESRSGAEALKTLETCPDGLSVAEAEERLARFGPNGIEEHRRTPLRCSLALFGDRSLG
jgi:hypothetical protein